jgi:hypothetical protein
MLNVRAGDRVQVRERCDEGYALTHVRTPPGIVRAVRGTGAGAAVDIALASGDVITYSPTELELLVPEPAA